MEESVGKLWHRLITHSARGNHPDAAVGLDQVRKTIGIFFRALGGDPGLQIEANTAVTYQGRRKWLQRIAGVQKSVELCRCDSRSLYLPSTIDLFPLPTLNRNLYLWLTAMASTQPPAELSWCMRNQYLTRNLLRRFPGLRGRYTKLLSVYLTLRPDPQHLPTEGEAAQELAIQQALRNPGSVKTLPICNRAPFPVHLWLDPAPPAHQELQANMVQQEEDEGQREGRSKNPKHQRRYRAQRVDAPKGDQGLLAFRLEALFSWTEYLKLDRTTDEEDDDSADKVAEDLDVMSVARDNRACASRLRFDLDLPAPANDDLPLGDGIWLPEWDYRRTQLRPDRCCLQVMIAADSKTGELPNHLRSVAHRLRNQFETLRPRRIWFKRQSEGNEIDLDAYVQHTTDRMLGKTSDEAQLYKTFRGANRDLACLLLADLSLSTDAWISNSARIIDVIRDSLFLFSEALSATRDRFAIHGFSSRNRQHVRFHILKAFDQPYNAATRGRLNAIKPGFYTRMGAAIRHACHLLENEPATQRLLLLLTDGKPNDLDQYEGRYGIEDTRVAVIEARRLGLQPFCVTIDERANEYLPHLFGSTSYVVIRDPAELPRKLPLLYARLTR